MATGTNDLGVAEVGFHVAITIASANRMRRIIPTGRLLYFIFAQIGHTWLSARCGSSTLLRAAHGITWRCSGRW